MTEIIVKFDISSMALKHNHIFSVKKRALLEAIAQKAFWSYGKIAPSKVANGKLIEKVLVYGNDAQRSALLDIFPAAKVQKVWEQHLVIQEPRLHDLNRKIASSLFHISNPEEHISKSFQKHNLYDRFSA